MLPPPLKCIPGSQDTKRRYRTFTNPNDEPPVLSPATNLFIFNASSRRAWPTTNLASFLLRRAHSRTPARLKKQVPSLYKSSTMS
mmetsp:Transcript_25712/g.37985  ORF Transcript_25712/g.37985 Transcript_25712/m.37985 type:complete len:85 (+) Transcript_25712:293-547(+)